MSTTKPFDIDDLLVDEDDIQIQTPSLDEIKIAPYYEHLKQKTQHAFERLQMWHYNLTKSVRLEPMPRHLFAIATPRRKSRGISEKTVLHVTPKSSFRIDIPSELKNVPERPKFSKTMRSRTFFSTRKTDEGAGIFDHVGNLSIGLSPRESFTSSFPMSPRIPPKPRRSFVQRIPREEVPSPPKREYIPTTKPRDKEGFLPLELFIDTEFETKSPKEWLAMKAEGDKGVRAKSMFQTTDGSRSWEPCWVLEYIDTKNLYRIEWISTGKQKLVSRSNLIFEGEDPDRWNRFINKAKEIRRNVEKSIRKRLFADQHTDTESIPRLTKKSLENVLKLAMKDIPKNLITVLKSFVADMQENFIEGTKASILYQHEVKQPKMVENLEKLFLPTTEPPKEVPHVGSIEIPGYSTFYFNQMFDIISKNHFIAQLKSQKVLRKIFGMWEKFSQASLFDKDMIQLKGVKLYEIDVFSKLQKQRQKRVLNVLLTQWVVAVESQFLSYEEPLFPSYKAYKESRTKRFIDLISYIMSDQFNGLVRKSLSEYTQFIKSFATNLYIKPVDCNYLISGLLPLNELRRFSISLSYDYTMQKLIFSPSLDLLRDTLMNMYECIRKCSSNTIPKIDKTCLSVMGIPPNYLEGIPENDTFFVTRKKIIEKLLTFYLDELQQLMDAYAKYTSLMKPEMVTYIESFKDEDIPLQKFTQELQNLVQQRFEINRISPEQVSCHLCVVDCSKAKSSLIDTIDKHKNRLLEILVIKIREDSTFIHNHYEKIRKLLERRNATPEELVKQQVIIEMKDREVKQLLELAQLTVEKVEILSEYSYSLSDEDLHLYVTAMMWYKKIHESFNSCSERVREEIEKFQLQLRDDQYEFSQVIRSHEAELKKYYEFNDLEKAEEYANIVLQFEKKLESSKQTALLLQGREFIFHWPVTRYTQLDQIAKEFQPHLQLWIMAQSWNAKSPYYYDGAFLKLDANEVQTRIESWSQTLTQVGPIFKKHYHLNNIVALLDKHVSKFKQYFPLIQYLRHPGFKKRHWQELCERTGLHLEISSALTLSKLIDAKIENHMTIIQQVADKATHEYQLEKMLDKMETEWSNLLFKVLPFRDSYILENLKEILHLIDDHLITTRSIIHDKFVGPFEARAKRWEQNLTEIQRMFEAWIVYQENWMYLKPIFQLPDIGSELAMETKTFTNVDIQWKTNIQSIAKSPKVSNVTTGSAMRTVQFQGSIEKLLKIRKGLGEFLERKRGKFSRFYFISNEELLEILANQNDLNAIQNSLKKLFTTISKLEIQNDAITAVHSKSQREKLVLVNPIKPENVKFCAEKWMQSLENEIKHSLFIHLQKALTDRTNMINLTKKYPLQVAHLVKQINWIKSIEQSLQNRKGLHFCAVSLRQEIAILLQHLRGKIPADYREILISLLMITLQHRDNINHLWNEQVSDITDFEYQTQLRYYWKENRLDVALLHYVTPYGFEYLGDSSRLVFTNVVKKCFHRLISAIHLHYGVSIEGVSGVGKKAIIQDFAKAFGKYCVIINCNHSLSLNVIERAIRGTSISETWCCFRNFSKLPIEIISVIAQHLQQIQTALNKKKVSFENTQQYNPRHAFFVTITPSASDESLIVKLPINVRNYFRSCSLVVPDYKSIVETYLLSFGFQSDWKKLATKILVLYRLLETHLEGFSLSLAEIMKFLNCLKNIKNQQKDETEDCILVHALMEINYPKLRTSDIPTFEKLIFELFGRKNDSKDEKEEVIILQKVLTQHAPKMQLIPTDLFISKCMQLHKCLNSGGKPILLVGEPLSGKSSVHKILAETLNMISEFKTNVITMNIKSQSIQHLLGYMDPITQKWKYGILSQLLKRPVSNAQWIVLDGCLDDSLLEYFQPLLLGEGMRLSNGEIVGLPENTNLIFEMVNLSSITPAVLGSCLLIYMDTLVNWETLVQQWIENLKISKKGKSHLRKLLKRFIPNCLQFVMKKSLAISENYLISNFIDLFNGLFNGVVEQDQNDLNSIRYSEGFALFSLIWTFGLALPEAELSKFSSMFRNLLNADIRQQIPPGSIFDYYYSIEAGWKSWKLMIPSTQVIPTLEITKLSYIFNTLSTMKKNILFYGPSGNSHLIKQLNELQNENSQVIHVALSAGMNVSEVQQIIQNGFQRKKDGLCTPLHGKYCKVIVHDLNQGVPENSTSGSIIELLRELVDQRGWYNISADGEFLQLCNTMLIATLDTNRLHQISPRLLRHFYLINTKKMDVESLVNTFTEKILRKLAGFKHAHLLGSIVKATVQLYHEFQRVFKPTPNCLFYKLNLRDISNVFQGVTQIKKYANPKELDLIQLWINETTREFSDRLAEEKQTFKKIFSKIIKQELKMDYETLCQPTPLLFVNFIEPNKLYTRATYEDVSAKLNTIRSKMVEKLRLFHLFPYTVEHIVRLSRIIQQPNGHAVLLGKIDDGRERIIKLTCHVVGYELFHCPIAEKDDLSFWNQQLEKLLQKAAFEKNIIVFYLSDEQTCQKTYLKDVHTLLCGNSFTTLFHDAEEKIINQMKPIVHSMGLSSAATTSADFMNAFFERARKNIRIVMCMNPDDNRFSANLQQFPSIQKYCTFDWYEEVPDEGIVRIGEKLIEHVPQKEKVVSCCVSMYHQAEQLSKEYKRFSHITVAAFIDLIKTFKTILKSLNAVISRNLEKYTKGYEALVESEKKISQLRIKQESLQPDILKSKQDAEKLMETINIQRQQADITRKKLAEEEQVAKKEQEAAQAIRDECKRELDKAEPVVQHAIKSLQALKKKDIAVFKALKNPPPEVRMVMQAILIMLKPDAKPERKQDPKSKAIVDDWWTPAKKFMTDANLLQMIYNYDLENIPEPVLEHIRETIKKPQFKPEKVRKASVAAESLCKWIRAVEYFDRVNKLVAPKRENLKQAEQRVKEANAIVEKGRAKLEKVEQKLKNLEEMLEREKERKIYLERTLQENTTRLSRATTFQSNLSSEKHRWKEKITVWKQKMDTIVGDALLSAGVITFLGPFTAEYRKKCISQWMSMLDQFQIPYTSDFTLEKIIGDKQEILRYYERGLLADPFNTENGLITIYNRRFPLLIDPQSIGKNWITRMYKDGMITTLQDDSAFLKSLENMIAIGGNVVLLNVGQEIPSILYPLIQRNILKRGDKNVLVLNEKEIPYSKNFRLFITTLHSNPKFERRIASRVAMIQFSMERESIQYQLIKLINTYLNSRLEERYNAALQEQFHHEQQAEKIDQEMLDCLIEKQWRVLDHLESLENLYHLRKLLQETTQKLISIKHEIDELEHERKAIMPAVEFACEAFLLMMEFEKLNPTYTFGYETCLQFFTRVLMDLAEKKISETADQIQLVIDATKSLICKKLFRVLTQRDRLIYSFLLCVRLNKGFDPAEWDFFVHEKVEQLAKENPLSGWLDLDTWNKIVNLSTLPAFQGLSEHILENTAKWKRYLESPQNTPLPWKLNPYQQILLLKVFRSDAFIPEIKSLISKTLGRQFIQSRDFSLKDVLTDSSVATPIIIHIIKYPADSYTQLMALAEENHSRLKSFSLGAGIGDQLAQTIRDWITKGGWIHIQNCHLMDICGWTRIIEQICQEMRPTKTNTAFRLFMTTENCDAFPILVLQKSVKIVTEYPMGIKGTLQRMYNMYPLSDVKFYTSVTLREWKKLLLRLCILHAIMMERTRYQRFGWNQCYEFTFSDWMASVLQTRQQLRERLTYSGLRYLISEVQYGGRIKDVRDLDTLRIYVDDLFNEECVTKDYSFEDIFHFPTSYENLMNYIRRLKEESPELYGFHKNVEISILDVKSLQASLQLIHTPSTVETPQQVVFNMASRILKMIPKTIDLQAINTKQSEELNVILKQEIKCLNVLLEKIQTSLSRLCKCIKGDEVMETEMMELLNDIYHCRVPKTWKLPFHPTKTLNENYLKDLFARHQFFQRWIENGDPITYWLGGFFAPELFLSYIMRKFTKAQNLDSICFDFEILEEPIYEASQMGCFVEGMYLECAKWDMENQVLVESDTKDLLHKLPIVHLIPVDQSRQELPEQYYECPVYKTRERGDMIRKDGRVFRNYLFTLKMATNESHVHWKKRGTAIVCKI